MSKAKSRYVPTCETCGNATGRTVNHQCVECYLTTNLPSKIKNEDEDWVWANNFEPPSQFRKAVKPDEETMALDRAILDFSVKVSEDGKSVVLPLEKGSFEVPLTVEAIDKLALRTGILGGKWLVYRVRDEIDNAWLAIARATFNRTLGSGAKVSTAEEDEAKRHVICIYTRNYLDLDDVKMVRGLLRDMGFDESLCYKPDIYTYLNIYKGTTKLSPCRYRE
jgi:hypothetical protein